MKNRVLYNISTLILITLAHLGTMAQEVGGVFMQTYLPKDYQGGPQNWDIETDDRGLVYFGNMGVLQFDGKYWRIIELDNESIVRSLEKDSAGIIYVGGVGEFGYLEPDLQGTMRYVSISQQLDSSIEFKDVWQIHPTSHGIYFRTTEILIRYRAQDSIPFKTWLPSELFSSSFCIDDDVYIRQPNIGMFKISGEHLISIPQGDWFKDKIVYSAVSFNDSTILICTRENGLWLYSLNPRKRDAYSFVQPFTTELDSFFIKNQILSMAKLNDELFAIGTRRKGLVIIDKNGSYVQSLSKKSGLSDEIIYCMKTDAQNGLWLGHDNGLSRVEINMPFRKWGLDSGLEGTVYNMQRFKDTLYVATSLGLYYLEQENNVGYYLTHETSRFKRIPGVGGQIFDFEIFKTNNSEQLLISGTEGVFEVKNKALKLINKEQGPFYLKQSGSSPDILYTGMRTGMGILRNKDGRWYDEGCVTDIASPVRKIEEDQSGGIWIDADYQGLFKISFPSKTEDLLHLSISEQAVVEPITTPSDFYSMFWYQNDSTMLFSTENGVYQYSNGIFETYHGLGEEYADGSFPVGSLHESEGGYVWINSNDVRKRLPDGSFWIDTLAFYKLPELSVNEMYTDKYNQAWFGGSEGLFRFDFSQKIDYHAPYPTLIRKVVIGTDSVRFDGEYYQSNNGIRLYATVQPDELKPEIAYEFNNILFEYSTPYMEQHEQNQYSYMLDGFDEEWSAWSDETKKEYTNLSEGVYFFRVKARNLYEQESTEAVYEFTIHPPWYRSMAAYILYGILFIAFVYAMMYLYARRLQKEKERLEVLVEKRTEEITKQKEEIHKQARNLLLANEDILIKNTELEQQKEEILVQAEQLQIINRELEKLSIVARETDNAIAIFDSTGELEWLNEGFTRMYGYTLEQYRAEKHSNIIDISSNPNIKELIRSCMDERKTIIYQLFTLTRNHEGIWAQTTLTPIVDENGKTVSLVAIDSNITELKNAQQEILFQKERMEQQRDELERANATKDKFFSIIAHDLRSPLATFMSLTNILYEGFNKFSEEQLKKMISDIQKSAQLTYNLLENLLDWSRSQRGKIKFKPDIIDVNYVVEETIELLYENANKKNIALLFDQEEPIYAYFDENMIFTVLRNLVSNAIKFTGESGHVHISVEESPFLIWVTVEDNGVGIEENDIDKLFRIDVHFTTQGTDKEKGTGLGLILCQEFVEKNGGEIIVESIVGNGTKFRFSLLKQPIE